MLLVLNHFFFSGRKRTLLFLQGCEAKLDQMLQDVLSYAMLVILGFAIIKVQQFILA